MNELLKIRDVSSRYGISSRTLRYYEEMGLLQSVRSEEYAYRLYDEAALRRLEQILILRKLNINLKDIGRVFAASDAQTVLEVLGKKVQDIDEEVVLLHELREIVMAFIRQIEQADFSRDSDVKLLYDKAKEIETQLLGAEYSGNPSPVHRLLEVTEKLEEKAVSRLQIPDNVLKRLLQNVYFIFGDGVAVADELGRRYGMLVYHTCDYRHIHHQNADPRFQPRLSGFVENMTDFFAQDPEEAWQREHGIVQDYTPMVIMDLIQLMATNERIICENAIDIDSILPLVTHAVDITAEDSLDDFIGRYEDEIRCRDISEKEKQALIRKVHAVWEKKESEAPGETKRYGVKEILQDGSLTLEALTEMAAAHFGLPDAE